MEKTCRTCKWGHLDTWGTIECQFPVPAWLLSTVKGLEDARGVNRLGDRLDANEVKQECPYSKCATWEPKP
jgi:hypothetical protein